MKVTKKRTSNFSKDGHQKSTALKLNFPQTLVEIRLHCNKFTDPLRYFFWKQVFLHVHSVSLFVALPLVVGGYYSFLEKKVDYSLTNKHYLELTRTKVVLVAWQLELRQCKKKRKETGEG